MSRRTMVPCLLAAGVLLVPLPAAEARPANHCAIGVVNHYRIAHGLPALRPAYSLWRSSKRYARHMMREDFFGHSGRIATSRQFRLKGENLALWKGWQLRYREVVRAWMRSPAHRRILLDPNYRSIGVARCQGRMGRVRATTWVMHAGRS